MSFDRLAVIGIGLIGGSFALAAKKRGLVGHVVGVARKETTLLRALERGAADAVTSDPAEAVREADLVYIATPVRATGTILKRIAPALGADALVTDATSTKVSVVAAAEEQLSGAAVFIGGHPMAGSEEAGPGAARADLFQGKPYLLTPTPQTPDAELQRLRDLLTAIGARVILTDPEEHDRLVAATSHLPHLLAAALLGALADLPRPPADLEAFVGSGLRDVTRIAKGPPEVWRDILLDNRGNIRTALKGLLAKLDDYLAAMDAGDAEKLEALLAEARDVRKGLDEA